MGDNRETWLLWDKETDEPESLMRGSTESQGGCGGKDDYETLWCEEAQDCDLM